MVKAALVDDNIDELNYIYNALYNEFKYQNVDIKIDMFNNPSDFKDNKYDVLFLDIDMPINGIDLAKQVITNNNDPIIIFITNRADKVYDTFQVHPYDFIKKNEIDVCLAPMVSGLIKKIQPCIEKVAFKCDIGIIEIDPRAIMYIETASHRCIIHSDKKDYTTWESLSSLVSKLDHNNFIQIHQAYIINWSYVTGMNKNDIYINGIILPVSRSRIKQIKQEYVLYLGRSI